MIDKDGYWRLSDWDKECVKKCVGCVWVAKVSTFERQSKCSRGYAPNMVWAGRNGKCMMKDFNFRLAMEHKLNEEFKI